MIVSDRDVCVDTRPQFIVQGFPDLVIGFVLVSRWKKHGHMNHIERVSIRWKMLEETTTQTSVENVISEQTGSEPSRFIPSSEPFLYFPSRYKEYNCGTSPLGRAASNAHMKKPYAQQAVGPIRRR